MSASLTFQADEGDQYGKRVLRARPTMSEQEREGDAYEIVCPLCGYLNRDVYEFFNSRRLCCAGCDHESEIEVEYHATVKVTRARDAPVVLPLNVVAVAECKYADCRVLLTLEDENDCPNPDGQIWTALGGHENCHRPTTLNIWKGERETPPRRAHEPDPATVQRRDVGSAAFRSVFA